MNATSRKDESNDHLYCCRLRVFIMGEIDQILSEEEIRLIIIKTVKTTDFRINSYHIRPASETPAGFLGEHYKVKVSINLDTKESNEFFYFVKMIPKSVPQHLDYTLSTRAFYKEIEMYKTLFVDFKNAQNTKSSKKWCPEYFYSKGEELFVVEDLSRRGFSMFPERTLMDEEYAKASLRAVAVMHAASFIFEEKIKRGLTKSVSPNWQNLSQFEKTSLYDLYSHLTYETEVSDLKGHPGYNFVKVGINSQKCIVSLLEKYTEDEKKKIREKLPEVLGRIFPLVKTSKRYRNVFIHGDLWANNLLFRKEENGNIEALIIDFQLARYAPPAHDLMMFFHLVQDQKFREQKQSELIDYYYKYLSKELETNGLSVAEIFPKQELLESCRFYRELGSVSAVLYFQLIMAPPSISGKFMSSPEMYEKIMLVDRSELITECFKTDEIFRNRMREAMDDVIKNYILI